MTALVMCYFIMKKKEKKEGRENEKHKPSKAEPVYDIPQLFGESSADIELRENTCYPSKSDIELQENTCYPSKSDGQ